MEYIFCDGAFFTAPKFSYQMITTHIYIKEFIINISILNNKQQKTYKTLFNELLKYINLYNEYNDYFPLEFHCDFEKAISNAVKKIFAGTKIRYYLWHFQR